MDRRQYVQQLAEKLNNYFNNKNSTETTLSELKKLNDKLPKEIKKVKFTKEALIHLKDKKT